MSYVSFQSSRDFYTDHTMEGQLGASCTTHAMAKTIWCCKDNVIVCYKCLLFGDHRDHKYLDEEETRYR